MSDLSQSKKDMVAGKSKITKIPKSFSIESLISNRKEELPIRDEILDNNKSLTNTFHNSICLPNFPIYSPWMGYLTQQTSERISQFFTNTSNNKHSPFSENTEHTQHKTDILSEMILNHSNTTGDPTVILNTNDSDDRDKLTQYFANNVRDPKLTEFLMNASDYNNTYFTDSERLLTIENNSKNSNCNFNQNINNNCLKTHQISQLFVKTDMENDKLDDMESEDSCSELSLTLSPNGSKNHGNYIFIFILLNLICVIYII